MKISNAGHQFADSNLIPSPPPLIYHSGNFHHLSSPTETATEHDDILISRPAESPAKLFGQELATLEQQDSKNEDD